MDVPAGTATLWTSPRRRTGTSELAPSCSRVACQPGTSATDRISSEGPGVLTVTAALPVQGSLARTSIVPPAAVKVYGGAAACTSTMKPATSPLRTQPPAWTAFASGPLAASSSGSTRSARTPRAKNVPLAMAAGYAPS
ncbi:MAG: hypothetical protein ABSE47_12115 [Acidimicrobiales bacterium]